MKFKVQFICFFFLSIFFGFFSVHSASADTFTVSGHVQDSSGHAISSSTVSVNDTNNDNTITDSSGNYSLSIPNGTYNIQVTPPSGSGFSSAMAVNQNISANTVLNFVLVPTGTVTLSGRVLDRSNQPLVNQTVSIAPSGTNNFINSVSDANGNYNFSVTPGSYKINLSGSNPLTVNAPPSYSIQSSGTLSLTQSIIMDIPLPAKQVVVHVQDANNVAQANVGIATNAPSLPNIQIGTVTNATGISSYSTSFGLKTDASGNVTLWLFPTPTSGNKYTITATPPSGSSFVTTNLSSVVVLNDTQVTLTMATPVTINGHVLDGTGQPIANQSVGIAPSGTNNFVFSTSDNGGNYSFSVAPGSYKLQIFGTNPLSVNAPPNYSSLSSGTLSLMQNTTMDIPLPINQVSLHVQDANGVSQANVGIATNAPFLSAPIGTVGNASGTDGYSTSVGLKTDASGNATLWLYQTPISGNRYTITATPPSGSNTVTTNLSGVAINGATQLTLTMTTPVTLSGHVLDRANQPLSNQTVAIAPSGTSNYVNSVTDSNGKYSFTVTPGNYLIQVSGSNPLTVSAPSSYSIQSSGTLTLTQNTIMDIPIPAKQVVVHVQDANGTAQANIGIATNIPSLPNIPIGTVTNATGISSYSSSLGLKTDASGNVTLWLFPTPTSGNRYTITATPPSGSIFNTFSLSNIAVTADQTELISLQYNHATPVTTANLATQYSDGTYADPTTVRLSATAAASYTVANTYYTIDAGAQQTYSTPFSVTGSGNHTITYWSVDTTGLQETPNTKTFTITEAYTLSGTVYNDNNQNGVQEQGETGYQGATVTLNTGQSTTTDASGKYSFSTVEAGAYVVTETIPSGYFATTSNPVNVALAANTTANFGISHTQPTTTANLSPNPYPDGTYQNPVTVTLSATAETGFTVASTDYTIDGGTQQHYTAPFTVSGIGSHTVTYWSTDNTGLQETPNTKTFTIASFTLSGTVYNDDNQNGVQDTGEQAYPEATVTLNTGQTTTTDTNGQYTFTNLQPGTYTETMTVPTGYSRATTNPVNVALAANTTQNFGIYSAPVVAAITTQPNPVQINTAIATSATFTDADTTDTHTATWNWGDTTTSQGTVTEPNGTTPGSVTGTHTYTAAGVYTVTLTVTDNDGAANTVFSN